MTSSDLAASRELRGWAKIALNAGSVKKIETFTATLNDLRQAFSNLNCEMKAFNENTAQSNKFLGRITHLQESMEKQTKAANRLTWLVVGLAALQVILIVVQILVKH